MNLLPLSLFGAAWLAGVTAAAQPTNPIQQLTLDPMKVTPIPVALDRLTTIRFPSPISDLQSARIAAEQHPEAFFLLSFQPGNAFFSVRALTATTNTSINVVWKNQTYVLELIESSTPWLSVVFDPPAAPVTNPPPKPVTPARLLGILDTAKAFTLLRQHYPGSVAGVEVVRPGSLRDYGDYTIRVEEVFRFDPEDTLVFRIGVSNKTQCLIRYLPESLMVRAGQRVYYQSIAEATGIMPVAAEVQIYFAVTGSADGSRNSVSPHNDFMVLLSRLESPPSSAPPASDKSAPQNQAQPVLPELTNTPGPPPLATLVNGTNVTVRPQSVEGNPPTAPRSPTPPAPVLSEPPPAQSQPTAPPMAPPAEPST